MNIVSKEDVSDSLEEKKCTLFFWINELIISELWENFFMEKSFHVFEIIKSLIQKKQSKNFFPWKIIL